MDRRIIFALVAITTIVMFSYSISLPVVAKGNPITMRIVLSKHGPLHVGESTDVFIFIRNMNSPDSPTMGGPGSYRNRLPNAYVVSSIDVEEVKNGVVDSSGHFVPPPNMIPDRPGMAGRWPMTVTCDIETDPISPPCNIVSDPAVLPGEEIIIFYYAQVFDATNSAGRYVYAFTVHGTINGQTLDLTAKSSMLIIRP